METTEKPKSKWKYRTIIDMIITASIFILTGLLIVMRNLGYLSPYLAGIFISWPMLVIIVGLWTTLHKHFYSGIFIVGVGAFFQIPLITGGQILFGTYWPWILVSIGVYILLQLIVPHKWRHHFDGGYVVDTDYTGEDGYVVSENNFGSVRKIVRDEIFKGARIKNSFGATILDLRRTNLQPGDTYVDIESSFGGMEIFIPDNWLVMVDVNSSFADVEDKHFRNVEVEKDKRLIIRGEISFSGVEIKN